jgi:hypothetical protein
MSGRGVPIALLALAVLLQLAFQTVQLVRESQQLAVIERNQDGPLAEATRLHQASDQLAGDVYQLAQSGNVAAKEVVDGLAKLNIVLHAPRTSSGTPAAAPAATAPVPPPEPAK